MTGDKRTILNAVISTPSEAMRRNLALKKDH